MKKITSLATAQQAAMKPWADKWIKVGLCTAPADRSKFEAAAEQCYRYANLPWAGRVVWVSSPLEVWRDYRERCGEGELWLTSCGADDSVRDYWLARADAAIEVMRDELEVENE